MSLDIKKYWSKDERTFFKICNFVVLSRKRINKIFESFSALEKLSNKSHYQYTENDINLIKGIILENLEDKLKKFNKTLGVQVSDIEIFQTHLNKMKEENLRLENENKRLQFVIENFVKENELFEIDDIKNLVNKIFHKKVWQRRHLKKKKVNFSKILKNFRVMGQRENYDEIIDIYKDNKEQMGARRKKLKFKLFFFFFHTFQQNLVELSLKEENPLLCYNLQL